MIIKLFGRDGAIHLIENVSNVKIHGGCYALSSPIPISNQVVNTSDASKPNFIASWLMEEWGPQGYIKPAFHEFPDAEWIPAGDRIKLIDYLDTEPCGRANNWVRVFVTEHAYICTNEGKNIEKVSCKPSGISGSYNVHGTPIRF